MPPTNDDENPTALFTVENDDRAFRLFGGSERQWLALPWRARVDWRRRACAMRITRS